MNIRKDGSVFIGVYKGIPANSVADNVEIINSLPRGAKPRHRFRIKSLPGRLSAIRAID